MLVPQLKWAMAIFVTAAVACAMAPLRAQTTLEAGRWKPDDVLVASVPLEAVLERHKQSAPVDNGKARELQLTLREGENEVPVDAVVRGADVRFDVSIGDAAYAMGRFDGARWRRTPNGVTRVVRSDVQGDDLDRWPIAPFSPTFDRCAALGTSGRDDVLACRDAFDDARFLYVSPAGRIEREMMREGSRVSTFRFRYGDGARAAVSGWSIEGAGGAADVTVRSEREAPAGTAGRLDPPFEQPPPFSGTFDKAVRISSSVQNYGAAFAEVRVNGRAGHFQIDDGTTQMLLDPNFAKRAGIATAFGHGIAKSMDVGPLHGREIAFETAGLQPYADGILGLEAFLGNVVHVDYRGLSVEVIPHAAFAPPPGAKAVAMDVTEGMPMLGGAIGDTPVTRTVPDLGSTNVVVPRFFRGSRASEGRVRVIGPRSRDKYLEGPVSMARAIASSLKIGPFVWHDVPAFVETGDASDIAIPLDAIVGTSLLRTCEWWFDYDGGRVWIRPY